MAQLVSSERGHRTRHRRRRRRVRVRRWQRHSVALVLNAARSLCLVSRRLPVGAQALLQLAGVAVRSAHETRQSPAVVR